MRPPSTSPAPFQPPASSLPPQIAPPGARSALPGLPLGQGILALGARFARVATPVTAGVTWRVYSARPGQAGSLRLVKEDKSANATLALAPGDYIVHVSVGLASAAKPVHLRAGEPQREVFELSAGGLRVEGQVGDVKIPVGQISFDIYPGSQFDVGDRRPLLQGVGSGAVALLPEGTYYIVSNYGDGNSVVRSDIRVQSGKLTDVTVTHRAAVITLKLVGERGGEALANTAWTVLTPGGDVIKESIGAFPRVVLAEGEYRALARNDGKAYQRDFKVTPGVDGEVEVMAR